jgi:hypothetical protein
MASGRGNITPMSGAVELNSYISSKYAFATMDEYVTQICINLPKTICSFIYIDKRTHIVAYLSIGGQLRKCVIVSTTDARFVYISRTNADAWSKNKRPADDVSSSPVCSDGVHEKSQIFDVKFMSVPTAKGFFTIEFGLDLLGITIKESEITIDVLALLNKFNEKLTNIETGEISREIASSVLQSYFTSKEANSEATPRQACDSLVITISVKDDTVCQSKANAMCPEMIGDIKQYLDSLKVIGTKVTHTHDNIITKTVNAIRRTFRSFIHLHYFMILHNSSEDIGTPKDLIKTSNGRTVLYYHTNIDTSQLSTTTSSQA